MTNSINTSQYILDTSKEYSIYTCKTRAIPMVADGLKDSQRKALWVIRNRTDKIKTISLAGDMISCGLYLHGEASAANAISMLAGEFCNNTPLLEGIGNFGSKISPTEFAAPRYTYVKKNKACEELIFKDIDIIPLKENYDGSTHEPCYFLPIIPTILLNGISGIAVGWSTEILPRSIYDLINATLNAIDGKPIKQIKPIYRGYDLDVENVEGNIWQIAGKLNIIDSSTVQITELPPDLSIEKFKERLNAMEDRDEITTYTDNSAKNVNIMIKFKRGTIKNWSVDKLINYFKLTQRKTERIVVINWDDKAIRQYDNAESLIKDFVQWRFGFYKLRYEKMLADALYELSYWQALDACFIGKLPEKLLICENKSQIVNFIETMTKTITLDDEQKDKIASLPSYRWTKESLNDVRTKINDLQQKINDYNRIISSDEERWSIYRNEIVALSRMKW